MEASKTSSFGRFFSLAEDISSNVFLAVATLGMFYEVVARYFLHLPTYWAEEWVPFLVVLSMIMGSSVLVRTKGHVNVGLLPNSLAGKNRLWLEIYLYIGSLFFNVLFSVSSWSMVNHAYVAKTLSESRLQTPMVIPYFLFLAGVIFMAGRTVEKLLRTGYELVHTPGWYKSPILPGLVVLTVVFYLLLNAGLNSMALLGILLFALLFLGMPVTFALGLATVAVIMQYDIVDIMGLGNKLFWSINKYSLLAIPFFIVSGNILAKGNLGGYLLEFTNSFMKKIDGGLGMAIMIAAVLFAAISGASAASAAALGAMALPILAKQGYPERFGTGLIAAGGTLAIIIPPSTILVLYGAVSETSITKLFTAGFLPGVVIAIILSLFVYIMAKIKGFSGALDYEIIAAVEAELKRLGAQDNFMLIASGGSDVMGMTAPCNRRLQPGDMVRTELTPQLNGYWAQICRSAVLGEPSAGQLRSFELFKEAMEAGLAAVRAGVTADDIARAENDVFRKYGYGEFCTSQYTRVRGHGHGLHLDEVPVIVEGDQTVLEENAVIIVHPNTYTPLAGYHVLGDPVVVKKNGYELLTATERILFTAPV